MTEYEPSGLPGRLILNHTIFFCSVRFILYIFTVSN
jgi:hypothetical protein